MKKRYLLIFSVCLIFLVGAIEDPIESLNRKQGINSEDVKNVSIVNKSALPSEISISSVQESNVDIRQVDYTEGGIDKKMFVVSFTSEGFLEAVAEQKISSMLLSFSGVDDFGSYTMLNSGSVTGLSTNVKYTGSGEVYVELIINGESSLISNRVLSSGENYDFELQSFGLDNFGKGDVVSLNVVSSDGIVVEEVNSIVKVEY